MFFRGSRRLSGSVGEKVRHRKFLAGGFVQGAKELGFHVGGEPAAFAGAGHHLAGDVLRGGFHQVAGLEFVRGHELRDGLGAEIAFGFRVHGEDY